MKMLMLIVAMLGLVGCAGLDDAMTPSMKIMNNDFDNSTIVRQPPVRANRGSPQGDAWHELGFEWNTSTPDVVYITAGISSQILNIYDVALIADDQTIQGITLASNNTEFTPLGNDPRLGTWSRRRFVLPINEFRKIAKAHIIKMKIVRNNDFSVSRFGQDYPDVTASRKIVAFMVEVDERQRR